MTPHNEWEKEFDERFSSTPAIADGITDSEECCNCGEDLSLELYDAFSEGYKMAIDDAKQFIATRLAQTRQETIKKVIERINYLTRNMLLVDALMPNRDQNFENKEKLLNQLREEYWINGIKDE